MENKKKQKTAKKNSQVSAASAGKKKKIPSKPGSVKTKIHNIAKERDYIKKLFDTARVIILTLDNKGRILNFNPYMEELSGYKIDEVRGKSWFSVFIPASDRKMIGKLFEKAISDKATMGIINPILTKEGREIQVEWYDTVLRDDGGNISGVLSVGQDVTARLEAEEKIKDISSNWQKTFDSVEDSIMITDCDFNIIRYNKATIGYSNVPEKKIAASKCYKVIHGTDKPPEFCPVKRFGNKGKYERIREDVYISKSDMWITVTLDPVIAPDGSLDNIIHTIRDITFRKKAEESLRESEKRFRSAIKESPNPVMIHAEDGEVIAVSRVWTEITGYMPEEIDTIEKWTERAYEKREKIVKADIDRLYKMDSKIDEGEYEIRTKSGDTVVWDFSSAPMGKSADGRRLVISTAKDITERKKTEQTLKESEENLNAIINNANVGIVVIQDGERVFYNDTVLKILEYKSAADYEKIDFISTIHPDDRALAFDRIKAALNNEKRDSGSTEIRVIAKAGQIKWVEANSTVIHWRGRKAVQAFIRDITEKKKMKEEKERLQEQLFQIQKIEAIGKLAGGIAHDFNNILCSVKGNTELLIEDSEEGSSLYDDLKNINESIDAGANLVKQLLMFSRKGAVHPELFSLNDLVREMQKMLGRLIGENIGMISEFAADPDMIEAERSNINQVLMNLVLNARDAMPSGGELKLATENIELKGDSVSGHPESRPGTFICLSVRDNGTGMSSDEIMRIFEPFYTTKEKAKGTGLGLSVVYGIVKQHSGWIEASSRKDAGTVFKVFLPAAISEEIRVRPHERFLASPSEMSGKILLIEDEEPVRKVARRMLQKYNFNVYEAGSVKDARKVFKEHKGSFDLIFTDNVLPDGSGVSLIEEFMIRNPRLKVIITSGYTDEKSGLDIIRAKRYRFVHKPYSLQDLLGALEDVLTSNEED